MKSGTVSRTYFMMILLAAAIIMFMVMPKTMDIPIARVAPTTDERVIEIPGIGEVSILPDKYGDIHSNKSRPPSASERVRQCLMLSGPTTVWKAHNGYFHLLCFDGEWLDYIVKRLPSGKCLEITAYNTLFTVYNEVNSWLTGQRATKFTKLSCQ